jgi:hypothetical protein
MCVTIMLDELDKIVGCIAAKCFITMSHFFKKIYIRREKYYFWDIFEPLAKILYHYFTTKWKILETDVTYFKKN